MKKSAKKRAVDYALRIRTLHDKGDYDPDTVLLHAMMECAAQYVDDVDTFEGRFPHDGAYKVCKQWVTWFRKEWPKREKNDTNGKAMPKKPIGRKHFHLDKVIELPNGRRSHGVHISKELGRWLERKRKVEQRWKDKEQDACEAIIEMRPHLWV